MLNLELGELYGMDSWDDVLDAIALLKEQGWSDSEIQEALDRSKTKKRRRTARCTALLMK
ncbi:MAG: hypothetical protein J6U54_13370 [Clostridiales bacterium]|nr:hypothetical protein [Clostridiales bacterium]